MNVFSRDYIDRLFEEYKIDPRSVPMEWQSLLCQSGIDTSGAESASVEIALNRLSRLTNHHTRHAAGWQIPDVLRQ